jgi:hypothetical protein
MADERYTEEAEARGAAEEAQSQADQAATGKTGESTTADG